MPSTSNESTTSLWDLFLIIFVLILVGGVVYVVACETSPSSRFKRRKDAICDDSSISYKCHTCKNQKCTCIRSSPPCPQLDGHGDNDDDNDDNCNDNDNDHHHNPSPLHNIPTISGLYSDPSRKSVIRITKSIDSSHPNWFIYKNMTFDDVGSDQTLTGILYHIRPLLFSFPEEMQLGQ